MENSHSYTVPEEYLALLNEKSEGLQLQPGVWKTLILDEHNENLTAAANPRVNRCGPWYFHRRFDWGVKEKVIAVFAAEAS
jgi:hypothetical protein